MSGDSGDAPLMCDEVVDVVGHTGGGIGSVNLGNGRQHSAQSTQIS
ncbi:Os01g0894650 [Oryza sativa Japonica Group]|uniref:Os01g0894650 protein n=1 Tax=Oryza sativa subsp. japonica TaxID=39947 RepID=C7IXS5_ORYSJ|nr:Os01g0894650 [Oryza sativa Japonica Group]|eukprot:NP_001172690.1 Os01g0894650 [Oryza sativa Japonica Group]